jgi:hypothetical protein
MHGESNIKIVILSSTEGVGNEHVLHLNQHTALNDLRKWAFQWESQHKLNLYVTVLVEMDLVSLCLRAQQ